MFPVKKRKVLYKIFPAAYTFATPHRLGSRFLLDKSIYLYSPPHNPGGEHAQPTTMRLLITGANSLLARAFIAAQPVSTSIRAIDTNFDTPTERVTFTTDDLRDPAVAAAAVADVDAIIHLAPLYTRLDTAQETLDYATRGTYQLTLAAAKAEVSQLILGSTLDLFAPLWRRYRVDESWRPRPQPPLNQLCPYLAELAAREVARVTGTPTLCLRLGEVVDGATASTQPFDPRWLHVDDGVQALERTLTAEHAGWFVLHIAAKGERAVVPVAAAAEKLDYAPQHSFQDRWPPQPTFSTLAQPDPIPPRDIKRVVIFGAGGPLGSAVASELAGDYALRLTDVQPIDVLANVEPQSPGAPLPASLGEPHEWRVVDVRDGQQVRDACEGMDAIINCSVVRYGDENVFRVNTVGAYNVMEAAVGHGIWRVVHTGPFMLGDRGAVGYDWDEQIVDDVPPRPGIGWIYFPSKHLGQAICQIFAQHYGLSVPALAFCEFYNPDVPRTHRLNPLSISWQDSARAIRAALEVDSLPHPFEYFHIGTDLPHDVFSNEKAKRLLNWQPQDCFEELYTRDTSQSQAR